LRIKAKHPDALVMRMWEGNVLNVHENVTRKKKNKKNMGLKNLEPIW